MLKAKRWLIVSLYSTLIMSNVISIFFYLGSKLRSLMMILLTFTKRNLKAQSQPICLLEFSQKPYMDALEIRVTGY